MTDSGYDPRAMVEWMQILAESKPAGQPKSFSTHPNPENRIEGSGRPSRRCIPLGHRPG